MSTAATLRTELRDLYLSESTRIQERFASTGNGSETIAERTALVEKILHRLWAELISPAGEARNFALVALGGFGRRALFPHSDVDILFLHADRSTEDALRDPIRNFCQELWDLRMKLGPTTRTLAECDQFDQQNVEFTISLLDCRYVAGDRELFDRLHDKLLPKFFQREGNFIIQQLAEVTRSRHAKYGSTVFHLEPNIKEAPGGLRDYNVACWMATLSAIDREGKWPDPETLLPESTHKNFGPALEFLNDVKPYLWRRGETYPATFKELNRLFANQEVDFAMSYAPNFAAVAIDRGEFPPTARTFVLAEGTIGNYNFLAIPFNASNVSGALVTINRLMSFDQLIDMSRALGNPFPLKLDTLTATQRAGVQALPRHPAALPIDELESHFIPEPDAEYLTRLEKDWQMKVLRQ